MKNLPLYLKIVVTLIAPLIVGVWALANLNKIWDEALQEFLWPEEDNQNENIN